MLLNSKSKEFPFYCNCNLFYFFNFDIPMEMAFNPQGIHSRKELELHN